LKHLQNQLILNFIARLKQIINHNFLFRATKNSTKKLYYFRNINETNFSSQKRLRLPYWEISIFETVDGQTSTGLRVSVLEIGDDAVVNILFLLLKTYFARVGSNTAVFFNLGSAEPPGSMKIFLGSAKYLKVRVG
jgi:hypothetical protein